VREDGLNCGECGNRCNLPYASCIAGICVSQSSGGSCSSQINTVVCAPDFTSYGYQYLCETGESPPSGVACDYVGVEGVVTVWCCNQ
jgi:hypothetical protein